MKKTPYRSAGLPKGYFSEVGNVHVHIDSPLENQDLVLEIVKELAATGHPGKLNFVEAFIAGRQRNEYPLEYGSHTPAVSGCESLDFFSTNGLKNRNDAIEVINIIGKRLIGITGVVVEVEQQIGKLDEKGLIWLSELEYIETIKLSEVQLAPSPSLFYEIHHAFDVPESWISLVDSLLHLLDFCDNNGVVIGGWFVFIENGIFKYRSNSFSNSNTDDLKKQIVQEQNAIKLFFEKEKLNCHPRTVVEKILQVCCTPAL